jgi:hypothetical protein
MDSAMITALAAAGGSLVGATASVITTWITQRTQTTRELTQARLREREKLYGEFITEASHRVVDALTHSLETPDKLVLLYGILGRIRLVSRAAVLAEAEKCVRRIVDLYAGPNMTIEQIHSSLAAEELDPLEAFSSACRAELLAITPTT